MRLRPRQNVERERQQPVARQDGGRLVVFLVRGRLAAAQIVIVHRGQVVMRKRIAVHELQRCAGHQGALARRLEQRGGFDHEERPQPLAAREAHVAHGLHQPRRARALLGKHRPIEQAFEQALDIGSDTVEALSKHRPGILGVSHHSCPADWLFRFQNQQVTGVAATRNEFVWLT